MNYDEQQVRGGDGRWARTLTTVEREARAAELRSQGLPYYRIAEQLHAEGMVRPGYGRKEAWMDVQAAMKAVVQEAAEDAIKLELDRLDTLHHKALEVLNRSHVTVSNGRVVELDGVPLEDDGPVLSAIDRIVKISESRRRLLGLDQPAKTQLSGGVTYEVVGIDPDELR